MELLRTDYTDAIWSGLKRYNEISNDDGTVSFQDVTQYSGKEKSFFGAKEANKMNEALNTIMSMVEGGTDLYTAFQNYFDTQKGKFESATKIKSDEFLQYLETLKGTYSAEISSFEKLQEAVFKNWFNLIKGQLSTDPAGNLQNQINILAANVHELRTDGASLKQEVSGVKKDISDKHSTGIIEIPVNKWSGTPSQISGRNLYTAEVKVKSIFDNVPEIGLYPVDKVPTEAEQEAFNKIKHANADTATAKVTLYAEEKPTAAIKVIIKGVTV